MTESAPNARMVHVLADDLTGSTDTVVQFRQAGWPAYLLLGGDPVPEVIGRDGPVAASRSLDTRALADEHAVSRTANAVDELLGDPGARLYLKIDSTMRGSVAAQITGALHSWSRKHSDPVAVICPAYPQMERIISQGRMLVAGVPLHESPAGSDPVTPVHTSDMERLVPGSVTISLRDDGVGAAERIRRAGSDRVIVDATDDDDLALLAAAINQLGDRAVPVGSAGLAKHLARAWHPGDSRLESRPSSPAVRGRIAVAITSLNEVSRRQREHLVDTYGPRAVHRRLEGPELADPESLRSWAADLTLSDQARLIVLHPDPEPVATTDPATAARTVATGMAAAVGGLVTADRVHALVLVGGDGAEATLAHLDAAALRVQGAAAEGVPLSRIVGGMAPDLPVVTKAGGFGSHSTLTDVVSAMLDQKEA